MKRALLQSAYVLHRRPYRETSFLVELFTENYGRLTVVAKSIRQLRSNSQGLLQPFIPLIISWSGKGELPTLSYVEAKDNAFDAHLSGENLFAGFYLNELLTYLLQKWDAHPKLYKMYERTLSELKNNRLEEKILRTFEKVLLEELGYGLLPKSESMLQNTFCQHKYYRFIPEQGFVLNESQGVDADVFSGQSLIAIAREDWQDVQSLKDAKRLIRLLLTPLLGKRIIYSRELFLK